MSPIQTTKSKRQKQDDSIMATNNSSIVSKRSVERLYYPEPHFFRYFVNKPQRRSPLINRGYWLRMHAIENIIQKFLNEPSDKRKIVMNLGCGYDPLAFQWLTREPSKCRNVMFVDIDYPELMKKKCEVILATSHLQDLLKPLDAFAGSASVLLRSGHYTALGCDLANTKTLDSILKSEFDMSNYLILCTAEVSVTYMNVKAADSLIAWASRYDDVRFCLLEQYLPDGPDHPFAQKMIQHFGNLQTPLNSIHNYPALADQERRFLRAGWLSATARDLWDLWSDPSFLSSEQRLALNRIEPFDEWEEFALFASHYFLLVAIKSPEGTMDCSPSYVPKTELVADPCLPSLTEHFVGGTMSLSWELEALPKGQGQRRFGAAYQISPEVFGLHGGLGTQRRLASSDVYRLKHRIYDDKSLPPPSIEARMCHTMTSLEGDVCLLAGGRTSPDRALADCWLRRSGVWERVNDLPIPLYRHCAALVELNDGGQGVLIYGGKSNKGLISSDWILWRGHDDWEILEVDRDNMVPRFGAVMASTAVQQGILLGGMAEDGTICAEIFKWKIFDIETRPSIEIKKYGFDVEPLSGVLNAMNRLGACLTWSYAGLMLIGGVSRYLLSQKLDVVCLFPTSSGSSERDLAKLKPSIVECGSRPLLVGHSVYAYQDSVALAGGGAVCFSFGTYWNPCIYTLKVGTHKSESRWSYDEGQKPESGARTRQESNDALTRSTMPRILTETAMSVTPRMHLEDSKGFKRIVDISNPVVMEDMDLGPCIMEWSLEALKVKVGARRLIVVHEATDQHMNFQTKNFSYVKKPFGEFIDQIAAGSKQYLRSLASEKPSQQPAQLAIDFPELASDFRLPAQLEMVARNAHSSPLRISGPVVMWLHYDVMANVLCQIRGTKRVLLYPPSDVLYLDVPPGASSSKLNLFEAGVAQHPSLQLAHPQEAILQPGDVLFIPPLWLHTACPTDSTSISVNIFFRNLKSGYAAGKDVYGNRDLQPYEKGRKDIEKIARSFHGLPSQIRKFYLERLGEELRQMSKSS